MRVYNSGISDGDKHIPLIDGNWNWHDHAAATTSCSAAEPGAYHTGLVGKSLRGCC